MKHDRKDVAEKVLEAQRLVRAGDPAGQELLAQILREDSLFNGSDLFADLARNLAAELLAPSSSATLDYKVELVPHPAIAKHEFQPIGNVGSGVVGMHFVVGRKDFFADQRRQILVVPADLVWLLQEH